MKSGNVAPALVPKSAQEGGGKKKAKKAGLRLESEGVHGQAEKSSKKKGKQKRAEAAAGPADESRGTGPSPAPAQRSLKETSRVLTFSDPAAAGGSAQIKVEEGHQGETAKGQGGQGTALGLARIMGAPKPHGPAVPASSAVAAQGAGAVRIAVSVPSSDRESTPSSLPWLVRFPTGAPPPLLATLTQAGTAQATGVAQCVSPPLLFRLEGASHAQQAKQGVHQGTSSVGRDDLASSGDVRKGKGKVLMVETPFVVYRSEPLATAGAQKTATPKPGGASPAPRGLPAGRCPPGLEASCQVLLGVYNKKSQHLQLLPLAQPMCRVRGVNYETPGQGDGSGGEMALGSAAAAGSEAGREMLRSAADAAAAAAAQRRKALQDQALLTASFGTKAQRRRVNSAARSRSVGDNEAGNALLAALPALPSLPTPSLSGATTGNSSRAPSAIARNIPPHDLTATSPVDAYPLSLLVPEEEWEATDPGPLLAAANEPKPAVFLKESAKKGQGAYPHFVLSRLKHLTAVGLDSEARRNQARCMLHLTYLYRFLKAPPTLQWRPKTSGDKKEKGADEEEEEEDTPMASALAGGLPTLESISQNLPAPLATTARLVRTFAEVVGGKDAGTLVYRRPSSKKDLLIETILVLGLHVDSFDCRLSTRHCASDFQLMPKQLVQYLRELGAKVVRLKVVASGPGGSEGTGGKRKRGEGEGDGGRKEDAEELYRVTLPVPLSFPELKRRRQAKKKD